MIKAYKKRIDEKLDTLIPKEETSLYQGARYSLLAPGKRIRPLFSLLTSEMLEKGSSEKALLPACALEMVHTYSLIHDDLPCMDNDDYRRGLPTLHKIYGDGHATLIGDYLLTYAFEVLAASPFLNSEQKIALIHSLSKASGDRGMIGGQILDIEGSENIEHMHQMKTAALFCVAFEFGGIIANVNQKIRSQLIELGNLTGQLFQIADDILDQDHPSGPEQAFSRLETLYEAAQKALSSFEADTYLLNDLISFIYRQTTAHS